MQKMLAIVVHENMKLGHNTLNNESLTLVNTNFPPTAQNLLFSGDFTKRLMYWKCHVHDLFPHFGIRKENSAFTMR